MGWQQSAAPPHWYGEPKQKLQYFVENEGGAVKEKQGQESVTELTLG